MTDIPESIKDLNDDQLRKELHKVGITPGPLTPTTRRLFQSRLAKKRGVLLTVARNITKITSLNTSPGSDTAESPKEGGPEDAVKPAVKKVEKQPQYFGVYVPRASDTDDSIEPIVFESKSSTLLSMKEHKNARFKVFTKFEDAKNYSLKGIEKETSNHNVHATKSVEDIGNKYATPKQEDLNHFMHFVEKGEIEKMREIIWKNPKYLITSADVPVILKASVRYNALHVAAKYNQPAACCEVLSILENPEFHKLMYSNTSDTNMNEQRVEHLLDLYLNTPEKGLYETPLHIACKFGFRDVVAELLSYSQCSTTMQNKFGDRPLDVVCARASGENIRLKTEIEALLRDQYFVPLLRYHDNSEHAIVGTPWDAKECSTNLTTMSPVLNKLPQSPGVNLTQSPLKSNLTVSALVGPMSKDKACKIHKVWATPSKQNDVGREWVNLRRTDSEKGDEHIGRQLAMKEGVGWLEYWDFLSDFADFSTDEGLSKLDDYLKSRTQLNSDSVDDIAQLSKMFEQIRITSANSNRSEEKIFSQQGHSEVLSTESTKEKMNGSVEINGQDCHLDEKNLVKNLFANDMENGENEKKNMDSEENLVENFHEKVDLVEKKYSDDSSGTYFSCNSSTPGKNEELLYRDPCHSSEESFNNVFSSPSSDSDLNLGKDNGFTNNAMPYEFLTGDMPTKLDRDVIRAIGDKTIDLSKFPNVARWRSSILAFSECERERWGTPRRRQGHSFQRNYSQFSSVSTPSVSTPTRNMRRFFCRTPTLPN